MTAAREISHLSAEEQLYVLKRRAQGRASYQKNRAARRAKDRAYYLSNQKRLQEKQREYKSENLESVKATRARRYRENRDSLLERRRNNPQERLKKTLRDRLRAALAGKLKAGSAVKDLGCTVTELLHYLEEDFKPGMTWKNYGTWHVDHRIPLALYDLSDRDQLLTACHFSNLQPLWANENLAKGQLLMAPSIL